MDHHYDLAIIGGGINGCGIARDAAGRGLSVFLCEMNDLASGTSSWSTKLIHGGLRYLEHYEFRLVREALTEREVLWAIAPHIIQPMRFVLPYHRDLRPAWLLRLGLFLYDHIGGRKRLPATKVLDLTKDVTGKPLKAGEFAKGFEYSDCTVDDSRLVVLNARDAADRGADIRTRTTAIAAERSATGWALTVRDTRTGARETVHAGALVNAGGPWVSHILTDTVKTGSRSRTRLVQGSHIVVPKLYEHDRSYIFQNKDGRIVFAIPYQTSFTLIGTTDRDYHGDPAKVAASSEEIAYLCRMATDVFAKPVLESDVVWAYSGVRPLYDDGASEAKAATRDYVLELDAKVGAAPVLSIFGGKITTYRRLAEEALDWLDPYLPEKAGAKPKGWTSKAALPGGEAGIDGMASLETDLRRSYPFVEPETLSRLARAYGTRAKAILAASSKPTDLGRAFGGGLTEAEVTYLRSNEWAESAEDVVWRRSKLGLHMSEIEIAELERFLAAGSPPQTGFAEARVAP